MHWTNKEELICVQEDGQIRIFTLAGKSNSFTLGDVRITLLNTFDSYLEKLILHVILS